MICRFQKYFLNKTLRIPQNDEKIVKKHAGKRLKCTKKNNAEKNNAEGSSGNPALFFFLYEREYKNLATY